MERGKLLSLFARGVLGDGWLISATHQLPAMASHELLSARQALCTPCCRSAKVNVEPDFCPHDVSGALKKGCSADWGTASLEMLSSL